MTELLDIAVAKLAALPPQEQDRIAHWLLQDVSEEAIWDRRLAETQDALGKLAAEARNELSAGNSTIRS